MSATAYTVVDEKSVLVDVFKTEDEAKVACAQLKRASVVAALLQVRGVLPEWRVDPPSLLLNALGITSQQIDDAVAVCSSHSVVTKTLT